MRNWSRVAVLFMVWIFTWAYALWKGGMTAWFLFYSLGVIMAYLLCFQSLTLRSVKAAAKVEHQDYLSDDDVSVTTTIRHKSWIPLLWLVIEQEWTNQVGAKTWKHREISFPWFRHSVTSQYKIKCVKRGKYQSGRVEIFTGDVFGFITKRKRVESILNFTVYPKPLAILPGFITHRSDTGRAMTTPNPMLSASQVHSVRDYVNGDPMNRIHWKTTARTNTLKTKELDTPADKQLMVFLDAGHTSYLSDQPVPLFEKCVQVTASLLNYAQENRYAAGLLCSDKQGCRIPLSVHFSLQQAYTFLAEVSPDGKPAFHDALWSEAARLPSGTTVLYVTAKVDDSFLSKIKQLRTRKIHVNIMFIYSTVSMSWHQRYLKQQLESMGCLFYAIQHTQMEWNRQEGIDYVDASYSTV